MADALRVIGEIWEIIRLLRTTICTNRIHAMAQQPLVTVCALPRSYLVVAGDHVLAPDRVARAWVHPRVAVVGRAVIVGKVQDQGDRMQFL